MDNLSPGRPYLALDLVQTLTFEVIIRLVFGNSPGSVLTSLHVAFQELMKATTPLSVLPMCFPRFQTLINRIGTCARFRLALQEVEEIMRDEVVRRRRTASDEADILGLLLNARTEDAAPLTDSELRDHLLTLAVAGHETTATTLAWSVWHLSQCPDVVRCLHNAHQEAGTAIALACHPYVRATVNELLRMHPISSRIGRKLRQPLEFGDYRLPSGTAVAAFIGGVHNDPALYQEPHKFHPERFLERSYKRYEFFPFGGGYRHCLGSELARMELALILSAWFAQGRFCLLATAPVTLQRHAFTMGPKGGVPVFYELSMAIHTAVAAYNP